MDTCERIHDWSYGHRVVGHEGKCKNLHGHNSRTVFTCAQVSGGLDSLGRVIDFSVIKSTLCEWIEIHWDHRLLLWNQDPFLAELERIDPSIVQVPFNPTAEALAKYLLNHIGPLLLEDLGIKVIKVRFEETRKCSAIVQL
jgi:6-pyruvoyltetrahydropterin/6-carboxytetrahydropterin synthase